VADRVGARGDPVLEPFEGGTVRVAAHRGGLTGEQPADPGTVGHGKTPPGEGWSAIQWEDNEPGAQTGRPGAVGPVRGLLGGTTSPAALLRGLTPLRPRRSQGGRYRPSTSFQKSAAGLSLIRSRVVSERRTPSWSAR